MQTNLVRPRLFLFASSIVLSVFAVLTGCAAGGAKSGLSDRLEQDGYSFMPPGQEGWFIANRSSSQITLAKAGRVEGETYLIEGSRLDLGGITDAAGLADYASDLHRSMLPPPRFRIRENETSDMNIAGAQCVLTHIVAEDRDPETGSNVLSAMLIDSVSTVCMHPTSANVGITLAFTHRSFPEDRDRTFEAYAQSVLQTQQFSPVNAQATN